MHTHKIALFVTGVLLTNCLAEQTKLYFELDPSSVVTWSHDGLKIYFSATGNSGNWMIHEVDMESGHMEELKTGVNQSRYPACCENHNLYFISDESGTSEFYRYSLKEKKSMQITTSNENIKYPKFSIDGKELLFVRKTNEAASNAELVLWNLNSGKEEVLYEDPTGFLGWPSHGPRNQFVYTYTLNGPDRNNILRINRGTKSGEFVFDDKHGDAWGAQLHPSNNVMYYLHNPAVNGKWGNNSNIRKRNLTTGKDTIVYDASHFESGLAMSPDGTKLAFVSDTYGYYQLYVMDLEDMNIKQHTFQNDDEFAWKVRKEGLKKAVAHYWKNKIRGKLFSEKAMHYLNQEIKDGRIKLNETELPELSKVYEDAFNNSVVGLEMLMNHYRSAGKQDSTEYYAEKIIGTAHDHEEAFHVLGADRALKLLDKLGQESTLSESMVNNLGYSLKTLDSGISMRVFRLNIVYFPKSANAYDSYGEILMDMGSYYQAIQNYRKSLELNPKNVNAKKKLRKLGKLIVPNETLVIKVAPDSLDIPDIEIRNLIVETGLPWHVLHESSGVEFLLIPPGSYMRGAAATDPYYGQRPNELPRHKVTISKAFYLSKYEITNQQYRKYNPAHSSGVFFRGDNLTLDDDTMPVGDVNWKDCKKYCAHYGFRLPTDAEWEYAARAGVLTRYPWGNDIEKGQGWGNVFNQDVKEKIRDMDWEAFPWSDGYLVSSPAGSFRPNGFGLYDMFGNMWEWVEDSYFEDEYSLYNDGAINPINKIGDKKTLRGGGFGNTPRGSGIPYKFGMSPEERFDGNGFRVVLEIPK